MTNSEKSKLTRMQKLAYGAGAGGWVMVDRFVLSFATLFYLPPGGAEFSRLPNWSFFGFLTLWGVISLSGRVVDSITDPIMAVKSDQSLHPLGRRRFYMALGVIPLAVLTTLIFHPPDALASINNVVHISIVLTLWYVAFTVYNIPYSALLADLSENSEERLSLSIVQAFFQIAAAAFVMIGGNSLLSYLHKQEHPQDFLLTNPSANSFFKTSMACAALAVILMLISIVFVPEKKQSPSLKNTKIPVFTQLRSILESLELRWFLVATVAYWFGFNTVSQCVNYYVRVLFNKDESDAALVFAFIFATMFLCFPFVKRLTKRFSRVKIMAFGALFQAVILLLIPFVTNPILGVALMILSGIPSSFVMTIPNSILADLAGKDRHVSGEKREGLVFATQAFFLKVNLGLSTAIIASLLQLGRSVENPLGVQLTGPVASVFLLLSAFSYYKFHKISDIS